MLSYCGSLFPIPTTIAMRLEKFQRDFFWDGIGDKFKFHHELIHFGGGGGVFLGNKKFSVF